MRCFMRKSYFMLIIALFVAFSVVSFAAEQPTTNVWTKTFPDGLILADGSHYNINNLKGKMIGLYFAAGWCRNCCAFSKIFVPFRNKFKDKFEVIFVNFDDQEKEMMSYMKKYKMPWPAIPFNSPERTGMKKKYNISEIPTLIVFTANGKMLTKEGRPNVQDMGDNAIKYWNHLASQLKTISKKMSYK